MIVRLILTIICLILLACFAGFNLDNKCNVNLLVHTFENVPVFVSIIISFAAGVIFTLPAAIFSRSAKKDKAKAAEAKKAKAGAKSSDKNKLTEKQLENNATPAIEQDRVAAKSPVEQAGVLPGAADASEASASTPAAAAEASKNDEKAEKSEKPAKGEKSFFFKKANKKAASDTDASSNEEPESPADIGAEI